MGYAKCVPVDTCSDALWAIPLLAVLATIFAVYFLFLPSGGNRGVLADADSLVAYYLQMVSVTLLGDTFSSTFKWAYQFVGAGGFARAGGRQLM